MQSIKRQSNMELLRIFSMIFIVIHHLIINGLGWTNMTNTNISQNIPLYYIGGILECLFVIGVNLFFLLSGYFQIRLSFKKFFNLIFKVYTYWIVIQFIGLWVGYNTFNFNFIKLLATPFNSYWFLKVYLIVMLISPLLNVLVKYSEKYIARYFFVIFLIVFSLYTFIDNDERLGVGRGYSLISACCLYLIGAFIKNGFVFDKIKNAKQSFKICGMAVIVNSILMLMSIAVLHSSGAAKTLLVYNNPLIVITSLFFFIGFTAIKIPEESKISDAIRFFSKNTLAVYLIHSSNKFIPHYRDLLLLNFTSVTNIYIGFVLVIPYAIIIFTACILIDKLFDKTIGKIIRTVSNYLGEKIDNFLLKYQITKS